MAQNVEYILKLRDQFSKQLKKANASVTALDKNVSGFQNTLRTLTPFLGLAAIGTGVKGVIQLGIEMEQTRVAFATFLKDGEKANKLIAELNQFANITPFNNQEVIKSGRVLLAANIPADKIRKTLKQIGDVSAGATVPLTEMAAIYSKAMNKGRLQAEELNQLGERGVPILQTFADMFGVTKQEVMKMGSEGKLTSDLMNQAFSKMTSEGGIYFNMMEKQSLTLGGKISTIQGKFQLLGAEIGENNSVLKNYADRVIRVTDSLLKNQDAIEKGIRLAVKAVKLWIAYKTAVFAYSKAVKIATIANNALRIAMIAKNKSLKSAIRLTKGLNVAMKANIIGLVVVALGALISKLIELRNKSKSVTEQQRKLNDQLKETRRLTQGIKDLNTQFKNLNLLTLDQKKELLDVTKEHLKQAEQIKTNIKLYAKESSQYKEIANLQKQFASAQSRIERAPIAARILELNREMEKAAEAQSGISFEKASKQAKVLRSRVKLLEKTIGEAKIDNKLTTTVTAEPSKQLQQTITSAAPKVFNINITKLIETQEINTTNLTEGSNEIKRQITEALLEGINESQIMVSR